MAGARGHGRGRGHRDKGRGRAAGSPPSERSSSPEEETNCFDDKFFEFVVLINEGPFGTKRLSEKFVQFLTSLELAGLHPREASCDFRRWAVEVLFDEQRPDMFLDTAGRSSPVSTTYRLFRSEVLLLWEILVICDLKSYTGNILGIGRNKGGPTPQGGAAKGEGAPPYGVGPSSALRLCPFAYIISQNPSTESHDTEKFQTPPPPISSRGIQEIASGTLPEKGIITEGLYITMPASGLMRE
ncbi:hypothetical protein QYE76_039856 [Lolium multiflorum]|uniref:Uncharacterized protein n=1 Tax=Lolium multiflorum TaxID=4521 RepID=A0AAD8WUW9_LOLMU|nr:hypothetical protein QYE76_039856 [Lolium multiflorum]